MNAVDTNVFVYGLDDSEPAKQAKAQGLMAQLVQPPVETVLTWQVAGELLSCLRKWESAGRITTADVEANFRDAFSLFPLRIPTAKGFVRWATIARSAPKSRRAGRGPCARR